MEISAESAAGSDAPSSDTDTAGLYVDLLIRSVLGITAPDVAFRTLQARGSSPKQLTVRAMNRVLSRSGLFLASFFDQESREEGRDFPSAALTMVGRKRLDNLRHCVETVLHDHIPGDLIETGAWRGGACILMRGILAAHGCHDRTVWVADSFEGLPPPDPRYPADAGDRHYTIDQLAIDLETVQANFDRYGLRDDQVRFLKGWFKDTLPTAGIGQLAVVRLDGDMYGSTMDGLVNLYPKLQVGGFLIVDDYALAPARQAVADFRNSNGIDEPIEMIDEIGAFWRRVR